MKTAIYAAALLLIFQYSASAQTKDSANLLADITSSERISLPESFQFEKSLALTFSTGTRADQSILQYKFRYPNDGDYLLMSISGLTDETTNKVPEVVVDFQNHRIINFMSFSSTKMALIHVLTESKKDVRILKLDYNELEATGKTKQILGYDCAAYQFKTDTLKGTVWLTSSIDKSLGHACENLGLSVKETDLQTKYILQLEAKNSKSREQIDVLVNQINLNDTYSINSQEYVATAVPVY